MWHTICVFASSQDQRHTHALIAQTEAVNRDVHTCKCDTCTREDTHRLLRVSAHSSPHTHLDSSYLPPHITGSLTPGARGLRVVGRAPGNLSGSTTPPMTPASPSQLSSELLRPLPSLNLVAPRMLAQGVSWPLALSPSQVRTLGVLRTAAPTWIWAGLASSLPAKGDPVPGMAEPQLSFFWGRKVLEPPGNIPRESSFQRCPNLQGPPLEGWRRNCWSKRRVRGRRDTRCAM